MEVHRQPPQKQEVQPGREKPMVPRPEFEPRFKGADKLKGKVVLISGGDSGIGRATAVAVAREGADVAIIYLDEHEDARDTQRLVEAEGAHAIIIAGDIGSDVFCEQAVERTVSELGRLDVLINNAAEQHEVHGLEELTASQLEQTFRTNVFGFFYLTRAALPHLHKGAAIINTASITAFEGHETLLDYSATKGAIVSFTRSLSQLLMDKGIRVNAVAPGPIWTPLIPASFDAEKTSRHGASAPMKRAGQPNEVAPCFVFLASEDASYMSGQVLHPNGGTIIP